MADGTYDVIVAATDLAGNTGIDATTDELTVDTTAPVVTVDTLLTNDHTPELTGTVDEPDAVIEVTVDGNSYAAVNNGDGTWTLADDMISPALADGTYDVAVAATDLAGNVGTDATTNELTIEVGNFQIVSGTDATGPAGSYVAIPVIYMTSDNDITLPGLGLRIHYNSSNLALDSLSNVYDNGLFVQGTPEVDSADFDQDLTTDTFVNIAWVDLTGQWPNEPLPIDLYIANFMISASLPEGATSTIRFSASSTAAGYGFQSTPVKVTVRNYNWDIDDNGAYDALTDGMLTMRYEFGFRDSTLIDGAVAPDANRSTATEIEAYLAAASIEGMLDIDGNGTDNALTDGLLIMRYLFEFRGDTLIDGAVAPDATRTTAEEIEGFIESYMPVLTSAVLIVTESMALSSLQETDTLPDNQLEETNSSGPAQVITPDPLSQTVTPGDPVGITVNYSTFDPVDETLSGLGLRIHYDSSSLIWDSFSDVYATGKIAQDSSPHDDTSDLDDDPSTDKYLIVAWADLMGNWPGEGTTPLALYTANFITSESFTGSTTVNFTASSTAAGYLLDAESATINAEVNEPPTVSLSNTITTLAEDTDTSSRIKVADIVVTDDALGTNVLSLSGADASLFEIDGTELYLKAGTLLDYETNPVLDVTVEVDDAAVGATPDDIAPLSIAVTDVSELSIERWNVRNSRKPGSDSISMSGMCDVPLNSILTADEIQVKILAPDSSEVCNELILIDPADINRGVYTYRISSWKGWPGGIILLKLNTNKQTFTLKVKGIDLANSSDPLTLEIAVGDYIGSDQTG